MPPPGYDTPTRVLIVTGPPAVGKTTVIKETVQAFQQHAKQVAVSGFYTEEVRNSSGERIGFDVVTVDGSQRVALARVGEHSQAPAGSPQLGKYTVDVASFESVALPVLAAATARGADDPQHVLVVDEVARMELFSERFVEALEHNLGRGAVSGQITLLAVAQKGKGLIATLKARQGEELFLSTICLGKVCYILHLHVVDPKCFRTFAVPSSRPLSYCETAWQIVRPSRSRRKIGAWVPRRLWISCGGSAGFSGTAGTLSRRVDGVANLVRSLISDAKWLCPEVAPAAAARS